MGYIIDERSKGIRNYLWYFTGTPIENNYDTHLVCFNLLELIYLENSNYF